MQIQHVGMTRPHYQAGQLKQVRMVVLHSTAGRKPGDYNWLRQGGATDNPVSIHYYIDKAGATSQMVNDTDIAWHAGISSWKVDGKTVNGCNACSLGIELENLNDGRDPYPEAQYQATVELVRHLVDRYSIPRSQLVRHVDISPGRKTDPVGFPWERFVADVYNRRSDGLTQSAPPALLEPLPPSQQLRRGLLDIAYRAAKSAYANASWPLLKESVSQNTGMPILAFHPPATEQGQDESNRTIEVLGHQVLLEAYGRDLYFADESNQIKRLSQIPAGELRNELLKILFTSVDPVKGFRPDQAFHHYYQEHIDELGVPIGPDHLLPGSNNISCQHYSLDTLIWNGKLIRLSSLTSDMYGADQRDAASKDLRSQVLDDLYQLKTGRKFDQNALFCQYAIKHKLGAPLAKAEQIQVDQYQLVVMPYALDTIYCRIPDNGDWRNVVVGQLPATLSDEAEFSLLSQLLKEQGFEPAQDQVLSADEDASDVLPETVFYGGLLGAEAKTPRILDLRSAYSQQLSRGDSAISNIVVFKRDQSIYEEFVADYSSAPWHYYIDITGQLYQLGDEEDRSQATEHYTWQGESLAQNTLTIALELADPWANEQQLEVLSWFLQDRQQIYGIEAEQTLVVGPDEDDKTIALWDSKSE